MKPLVSHHEPEVIDYII